MKKRSMALILCISMVLSLFVPIAYVFADTDVLTVKHGGFYSESVSINYDEKTVLTASYGDTVPEKYQWQILIDAENGIWADIYDKTEPECEVSYALVKNILEDSGEASIRCKAFYENDWAYSNPVRVAVSFNKPEPIFVEEPEPVLVSDAEVVASEAEEGAETVIESASYYGAFYAAEGEGEEEKEYVTVTIHYLDAESLKDGIDHSIYTPYVATVEKESAFEQDVISPTYLGFAPYTNLQYSYDKESGKDIYSGGEDATVIELNYAEGDLTEDVVFKVYYKAIEVPYSIRYFFQNVNDDLYSEKAEYFHSHTAETGTIIEDSQFESCDKVTIDTTGFAMMYHIPDAVAADGSTVFEVYYDRLYYLIQFDFNGGYGSDPIYARYGTPFVVNTPVNHGYVFDGWDLLTQDSDDDGVMDEGDGVADIMPSTIPAQNQKYKALWKTTNTTYTVVYWRENADDKGYSYWGQATMNATSASYVSGSDNVPDSVTVATVNGEEVDERSYFTYNDALTDKDVLIEGDGSSVINVYYTRNYYTITFTTEAICGTEEGHSHSDSCYDYICEGNHIHDENCELICGETVHTHSDECCGITEHIHNASCCILESHPQHDENCCILDNHPQHDDDCCEVEEHTHSSGCCTKEEHTHSLSCIFGSCPGEQHTHGDGNCTCGKTAHTHGDGNCTCGTTAHTHGDGNCNIEKCQNGGKEHIHSGSCYNCGKSEHTHTDACLRLICGIPEGHSHSSTCTNASRTNTVKIIKAKYQQSLKDIFPVKNDVGGDFTGYWWDDVNNTVFEHWTVSLDTMPGADITFEGEYKGDNATIWYYTEALPGEEYEENLPGADDKHYSLYKKVITVKSGYLTEAEEFHNIEGFEKGNYYPNNIFSSTQDDNYLYYTRKLSTLKFHNVSATEKTIENIKYGYPLSEYYFVPQYPVTLEPDAYIFDGWYTTPECFDGTEVDWDTITMPSSEMTLYAKWVKTTHTVNFFVDYDKMLEYEQKKDESLVLYKKENILHRETVGSVTTPEKYDGEVKLNFGGWFYIENGEKKAFTPTEFPVNRDMNVFADWTSMQTTPYKISYVLRSDHSVKVADDTTGFAYVGTTRTFNAKAGDFYNQLYDFSAEGGINYNIGYFPIVASHSITMQYEDATMENATLNTYTFEYVQAQNLKYIVRYVNKETGVVMDEKVETTSAAVVTERFVAFENMVPDAFYKRLILAVEIDKDGNVVSDLEQNVITFYYTPNSTSAYYAVHYMLEKLNPTAEETAKGYAIDGSGIYEETGSHIEGIGDIGKTVGIIPMSFSGFSLEKNMAKVVIGGEENSGTIELTGEEYSITVTEEGTELYIFYERNEYPYEVYYYLYNSTDPVPIEGGIQPHKLTDSNGNKLMEKYGDTVTETAVTIPGYTCVSAVEKTITIREEKKDSNDDWVVEHNKIIFYYSETQYTVEYIAVPPEGGTLSNTIEVRKGTGNFEGSVPTANEYYEFVGWFTDEACTQAVVTEGENAVGTIDPNTKKFTPNKAKISATDKNRFYAKFELQAADFTISRENATDDDPDQVFVYEVKSNEEGSNLIITVTVVGNGSTTICGLPLGNYTVTQLNNWSWRYSDSSVTIYHEGNPDTDGKFQGTTVVFDDRESNSGWLSGNSSLVKNTYPMRKEGT